MEVQIYMPYPQTNAFFKDPAEIPFSLDPRNPRQMGPALYGEPLPPLGPAAGEHAPAALGLHPGPESVNLLPFPIVGLERSLHGKTS